MTKAERLTRLLEGYKAKLTELQEELQDIEDDNACHGNEYRMSILNKLNNWSVSVLELGRNAQTEAVYGYREEADSRKE